MMSSTVKYRSRTDIIVSMLEAARFEATKTKIMYSSYLSSHQLRVYLELGIRNGLFAYDSAKQRYRTTEKGLRLLELYNNAGELELADYVLARSESSEKNHYSNGTLAEKRGA
jgi:predicted transcriptional regulator